MHRRLVYWEHLDFLKFHPRCTSTDHRTVNLKSCSRGNEKAIVCRVFIYSLIINFYFFDILMTTTTYQTTN